MGVGRVGWGWLDSRLPSLAADAPEAQEMVSGGHEEKPRAGAARMCVFKNSAPGLTEHTLLFSSFFRPWTCLHWGLL